MGRGLRFPEEIDALLALLDAMRELLGHFDTGSADMQRARNALAESREKLLIANYATEDKNPTRGYSGGWPFAGQ